MRVHSNIEKLKAENPELLPVDDSVNVADLAPWKLADPYLVWNIQGEGVLVKITNNDATVHGVLHEIQVNVTKSRPTGTSNESMQKVIRGTMVQFKHKQQASTE